MTKLEPLEKTLAELTDAEKVRRAQKNVSKPTGNHHYDRLPVAIKQWHKNGKWYKDKVKNG